MESILSLSLSLSLSPPGLTGGKATCVGCGSGPSLGNHSGADGGSDERDG
jgi:hypothetical protein